MQKRKRQFLILKILMGSLVFFALLLGSTHFFTPSNTPANLDSLFASTGGYKSVYLEKSNGKLHGVLAGNKEGNLLVFIHGSPGSWTDFASMADSFELDESYQLLFIDRPGFGNSDLEHSGILIEQATYIEELINQLDLNLTKSVFVFGHSYGGPVACAMAVEFPERVDGLGLIAPCIAWPYQVPKWYNSFASFLPVNLLLGDWLKNSNREMVRLYETELLDLEKKFSELKMPIVYVQGEKDILVDSKSAEYFKERCRDCKVEFIMDQEMNHFVPWSNPDLIFEAIEDLNSTTNTNLKGQRGGF